MLKSVYTKMKNFLRTKIKIRIKNDRLIIKTTLYSEAKPLLEKK
jgi:hypothetical protein